MDRNSQPKNGGVKRGLEVLECPQIGRCMGLPAASKVVGFLVIYIIMGDIYREINQLKGGLN